MKSSDFKAIMEKVNDYWINENPNVGICAWERGAYFLGNTAAYEMTQKRKYLDYAVNWADRNGWRFYDDEDNRTTNADNILCGETYLDLMDKYDIVGTDKYMLKTMEWTLTDPSNDYWWWVDTMYMAMNLYNRLGIRQDNPAYFDKCYRLYYNSKTERRCYDEAEHLWYRDERFLPDKARTASGKKVFWSRGNGWIFGGLARTLETIDYGNRYYDEYCSMFTGMAKMIQECQCPDGFWHTSLIDPKEFDMPETSGTVLFVLGILKGIRLGILNSDDYLDTALRGFNVLTSEALSSEGRLGWVQVVAWGPGEVKKEATNDYAVGAYLQVLREMIWLMGDDEKQS